MRTRRPKAWRAALCGCCEDPLLVCTVLVCGCNATGQVYQRATGAGCVLVAVALWTAFLVTQSSNQLAMHATHANVFVALACSVAFVTGILAACVVCRARQLVRARDNLPPASACADCCTSYWCGCCAVVQLLRHDEITSATYRPCAPLAV